MRNRTIGRELALKFLFMRDLRGPEVDEELDAFLREAQGAEEARSFARELVTGYLAQAPAIDACIDDAADNWDLKRMAAVDRNVLRLATFELTAGRTPTRVAINEAIELGRKFGASRTPAFINGILDRIRRSRTNAVRPPDDDAMDHEA